MTTKEKKQLVELLNKAIECGNVIDAYNGEDGEYSLERAYINTQGEVTIEIL